MWVIGATPALEAQSRYPMIVTVICVVTGIMCITVGIRAWVRAHIVKNVGVDDWILFASAVMGVIYAGLALQQTRLGLGLTVKLRPAQDLMEYTAINYAGRPIYNVSIAGFKIALCFTYLRITNNSSLGKYRLAIWGAMVYTVLVHLITILLILFSCKPISKSWSPLTPGKCLPTNPLYYGTAAFTISCDVVVFIMPVPLVSRLQMERRKRYGLIFAFVLGLFTTVCSIMRLLQVPAVAKGGDPTMLILWAVIETDVGIITSSIPTLAPLLKLIASKSSSFKSGNKYDSKAHEGTNNVRLQSFGKMYGCAAKKDPAQSWETGHGSEEDILPLKQAEGGELGQLRHITKTTDVNISSLPRAETGRTKDGSPGW